MSPAFAMKAQTRQLGNGGQLLLLSALIIDSGGTGSISPTPGGGCIGWWQGTSTRTRPIT